MTQVSAADTPAMSARRTQRLGTGGSVARPRSRTRALPPLVIAWAVPSDVTREIREALQSRAQVCVAGDLAAVRTQLARAADACLVVAVPTDPHDGIWEALRTLRRQFPSTPVVAVAVIGHSSLLGAWRLGRAEVSELVSVNERLDADDFRIALGRVHADGVVARLWARAHLQLPDPLVTIVRRALRLAHTPFNTTDLADVSQLHERSLRKYCERHRIPSPQQLVGWTRLLLASYYLDERGRAMREVAELLQFSTPGALRKLIARYTGQSPSALRTRGALDYVARTFEATVVPAAHGQDLGVSSESPPALHTVAMLLVRFGARHSFTETMGP